MCTKGHAAVSGKGGEGQQYIFQARGQNDDGAGKGKCGGRVARGPAGVDGFEGT